ncbi:hypothetical protein JVX92_00585 [Microbacterium hominis]|uniref:hypothetical protein n=1 Tax=Microbacterium hominis TaxID=162426 RepID=UPI0019634E4E|nr:hypothetical protein [Microbacterium hominis]QRY40825.1 hypothetical protein JVX92_00585 [Microbacterium hominis]
MSNSDVSEALYFGIKSLRGWYEIIQGAEHSMGPLLRRNVGTVLSSVLLAGGEEVYPVAVTGSLDESGTGTLLVVYPNLLVTVDAARLDSDAASHVTKLWPANSASDIVIETKHSYYYGTEEHPRDKGFVFSVVLGGQRIQVGGSAYPHQSPLVEDSAIYEAFKAIRDRITA